MQKEMMELDQETLLSEVNKAIQAVLIGGQSYKIGSRQLTRADLGMLKQLRTELMQQSAAESENGLFDNTVVAEFGGR